MDHRQVPARGRLHGVTIGTLDPENGIRHKQKNDHNKSTKHNNRPPHLDSPEP